MSFSSAISPSTNYLETLIQIFIATISLIVITMLVSVPMHFIKPFPFGAVGGVANTALASSNLWKFIFI
jgi:hypothetical protein